MPEHELTFTVVGMSCGHCKATIERALHQLGGVQQVNVDADAGTVTVHGSRLDEETLRQKIDDAGYVVRQRTHRVVAGTPGPVVGKGLQPMSAGWRTHWRTEHKLPANG